MTEAFRFEELAGGIALLAFDRPGEKVNTFSQPVLAELEERVSQLEERTDLRGLLFRSDKPGQFIAGADLNELQALAYGSPEQIEQALQTGQMLFDRISRLPFPTVALIDGSCMGGGTELVLAMDERVLAAGPRTQIALPEVTLGLIPAWGGTQRLPRLIGVYNAIQMITSGESLSPRRAVELGLAFDAVPAEELFDAGCRRIEELHADEQWQQQREKRRQPIELSNDQAAFMFAAAESYLKSQSGEHYPAPLTALKSIREGYAHPLEEALKIERQAALRIFGTETAANLIAVFFMNNRLSRDPGVENAEITPRAVERVGVLGAGLMGAGIATAHARRKIPTCMVDVDNQRLEDGLQRARQVVESRIRIGRATQDDLAEMLARLSSSTSHRVFTDCDVLIEAVPENEELKTGLYQKLHDVLPEEAILASNTSTISITRMAASAPHPERFIGMHFFNPVDRMKLVEVVRGKKTDEQTTATIVALAKRLKKTPIVVRDCPGFLVNRVLFPYMNEAVLLLQEGASMDQIDRAAERFGMPMGPFALYDLVGLDTAAYAGRVVHQAYSDRMLAMPLLDELVQAGRLGKKSGAGFRKFAGKKGRPQPDPDIEPFLGKHCIDNRTFTEEELIDRLFLPMLLEATRLLEEGIVRQPGDIDMGVILGIGFPAFRGGLLRWCDSQGAGNLLEKAERYTALGKRFEPTDILLQSAQSGERFHPRPKVETVFGAS